MKRTAISFLTAFILCIGIALPNVFSTAEVTQSLPGLEAFTAPYAYADEADKTIPDERLKPRVVDKAHLLNEDDEAELLAHVDTVSEDLRFDIVIATTPTLGEASVVEYADDFYDYNGYGFGSNHDGVILVIAMDSRDWYISTTGYGITAFTDAGIQYIGDQIVSDLGEGDYYGAFNRFVDLSESFVLQARDGQPYDVDNMPRSPYTYLFLPIGLGIGVLIAYIMATFKKKQLISVEHNTCARDYAKPDSLVLSVNNDRFIRTAVTSHKISSDSGSGGGSSSHTSSSGTSHGGGGGKF